MKVQFVVEVEIDPTVVEREGKRYGLTLQRATDSVVSDLECRLNDTVRHRDGVIGVRVQLRNPSISGANSVAVQ